MTKGRISNRILSVTMKPIPWMAMLMVVIGSVLLTNLAAASSFVAAPSAVKGMWSVRLNASTYFPEVPGGFYGGAGYSTVMGDAGSELYATTDIEGRLYAIDAAVGTVRWTYNDFPRLPTTESVARQIVGTNDTVVVLRGPTQEMKLYGFDSHSGNVKWFVALNSSWKGSAQLQTFDGKHFIVSATNYFAVYEFSTGAVVWMENLGAIDQLLLGVSNCGRIGVQYFTPYTLKYHIGYYDALGGKLHTIISTDESSYLMHIDADTFMWIGNSDGYQKTTYNRFNTTTGNFIYSLPTGGGKHIQGFGIEGTSLYFHFTSTVGSYDLMTGAKLGESAPVDGYIGHILGYTDYVIIAVDDTIVPGKITIYCYKQGEMSLLWKQSAMTLPMRQTSYGNWAGDIFVPTTSGFSLLDGNDGGSVLANTTGYYSQLALKSVYLGSTTVIFTYGNMATGLDFGSSVSTSGNNRKKKNGIKKMQ